MHHAFRFTGGPGGIQKTGDGRRRDAWIRVIVPGACVDAGDLLNAPFDHDRYGRVQPARLRAYGTRDAIRRFVQGVVIDNARTSLDRRMARVFRYLPGETLGDRLLYSLTVEADEVVGSSAGEGERYTSFVSRVL